MTLRTLIATSQTGKQRHSSVNGASLAQPHMRVGTAVTYQVQ